MRKIIIVLMCIGILVSWQICQSDFANAGNNGRKCSIAGLWKFTTEDPILGEFEGWITYTPIDPAGKKFVVKNSDIDYYNASFDNPFFPVDTEVQEGFGYGEKKSKNVYEFTGTSIARSNEEKRNVWRFDDRTEVKVVDCDYALLRGSLQVSLVIDGVWVPWECNQYTATLERITLAPACGDLPDWPVFE